ncbi:hypothetical protein EON65_30955 [archaeon]|nr:MAG: hypothetical protein EON65_30955 [archaeon]
MIDNDESFIRQLENMSFYDGESYHIVHRQLKIPLSVVKIAHYCCNQDALIFAQNGDFQSILFSKEQDSKFMKLQIQSNLFLRREGRHSNHLYHLTPRLILPYQPIAPKLSSQSHAEAISNPVLPPDQIVLESSNSKKKRKAKKKRKSKSAPLSSLIDHLDSGDNIEAIPIHTSNASEIFDSDDEVEEEGAISSNDTPTPTIPAVMSHYDILRRYVAIPTQHITTALSHIPTELHEHIFTLCDTYEGRVQEIRETYENLVQTLNLRLYVAESEIERLTEDGRMRRQTSRLNLTG